MQVTAICRAETSAELRLLEDMYRLRALIVGERLGWVECQEDFERDEFDALDPTYILAVDTDDHVIGCARLLPACGPTMLESVFSSLLEGRGKTLFHSPNGWFAVIMMERRSYLAEMGSKSTLVSA